MKTPINCLLLSLLSFYYVFSLAPSASAGMILSFRTADLQVAATGGTVVKSIDLLLTYDGTGNNLLSAYDLKITVPAPDLTLVSQAVSSSELQFSRAHFLVGSDGDYLLVGNNEGVDNSLVANVNYRLATLDFNINTVNGPRSFPIQASVEAAVRGAGAGVDIVADFTFQPASFVVTSVPEPGSCYLVAVASSIIVMRRASRRVASRVASRG